MLFTPTLLSLLAQSLLTTVIHTAPTTTAVPTNITISAQQLAALSPGLQANDEYHYVFECRNPRQPNLPFTAVSSLLFHSKEAINAIMRQRGKSVSDLWSSSTYLTPPFLPSPGELRLSMNDVYQPLTMTYRDINMLLDSLSLYADAYRQMGKDTPTLGFTLRRRQEGEDKFVGVGTLEMVGGMEGNNAGR